MRTQILKINGVHASQLAKLHDFLALEDASHHGICGTGLLDGCEIEGVDYGADEKVPLIQLLKSEYNPKYKTYTVELRVPISAAVRKLTKGVVPELGSSFILLASRRIVDGIYDALEIYPEEEQVSQ